jgi:hypothetical protein
MIQAATRGKGDEALADHLMCGDENEVVEILPARGVAATGLRTQLREMVARAAHGRTHRPIHHLHADPSTEWTEAQYARHLILYETEFGLVGQPRLAVRHRKHGRGHRHYVWSLVRRDGSLISMSHDYARREKISRILEFEFGEPHVAGRHNRAVAAALRREGRMDVAASIEAAGLLEVERPMAQWTSAEREQAKRTRVRKPTIENAVLTAWRHTSDGPGFEATLEVEGLALAMGNEVPVLVDRTGNVHPLARLIGKLTQAADGRRIGAAEVQRRIEDVKLRPLQDVRLESQATAIVSDLEHEIVSTARQATSDRYHELPGDSALLAELAEIIPITGVLAAEENLAEVAAISDDGVAGLPGYTVETRGAEALIDEATIILAMDQDDNLEAADDAEMAAADMIDALASRAMVPDGDEAFEEETRYAGRPNQSGSTGQTRGDESAEDDNAGRAEHSEYLDDVHRDAPEHAAHSGANGQDCRTSAGRPVDAETPSGAELAGAVGPDHPQPGTDDRHDGRNAPPPAAAAGTGERSRINKPVSPSHTGSQLSQKPLETKLADARVRLRNAERQTGWLPGLLKRWFNLSIGSQAEVDRARFEVEQLETQINSRNLLGRQQQQPPEHRMNNVPPDVSAAEISTNAVQMPIGRGATGRVTTQTVSHAPSSPRVPDGVESSIVQSAEAEDWLPTPDS